MLPTFKHGQEVLAISTNYYSLKIGDIVVFTNKNNLATIHRIVGRKGKFWIMKGDNNKREDRTLLSFTNYIGKII